MLRISLAALLLTASAVANGASCPSAGVQIFATPGHISPAGELGGLADPVVNITTAIPESTYVRTPYLNDPNGGNATLEIGPGQPVLQSVIEEFVVQYPKSPYVLLGYSQGACITTDTLCGASLAALNATTSIHIQYTKNLIASVVYGDETRASFQPYDKGTCLKEGNIARRDPASCLPHAPVTQSYCDSGDLFCCIGGQNVTEHFVYPENYDSDLLRFVVQQYNVFKASHM